MTPFPLAGSADVLLGALRRHCPGAHLEGLTGHQLMAERSLLSGLHFRHGVSAGGSCRLLPTLRAPLAVNLPRESDWELVPAWLEVDDPTLAHPNNWDRVEAAVAAFEPSPLIERGRQLGLAVAGIGTSITPRHIFAPPPSPSGARRPQGPPLVVDLSALWAGPLGSHLLWLCGANVVKVESRSRPDGGREGNRAFYALLNQGKRCVALDLHTSDGHRQLHALLAAADIVIESSRPRALRQMGIVAEDLIATRANLTWISLTGYGREEPKGDWIAFGDDAGVAAGMTDLMFEACGSYEFAGDAIADPLTGIDVALAAMNGWLAGGSSLVSIALADLVAWAIRNECHRVGKPEVLNQLATWWQRIRTDGPVAARRPIVAPVRALGEDTSSLLAELDIPCW